MTQVPVTYPIQHVVHGRVGVYIAVRGYRIDMVQWVHSTRDGAIYPQHLAIDVQHVLVHL